MLDFEDSVGLFSTFLVIVLGALLLCLPFARMDSVSRIRRFQAIQETVEAARELRDIATQITPNGMRHPILYETAALTHKIIEANGWLASAQYLNSMPIIGLFVHGDVAKLEPIN